MKLTLLAFLLAGLLQAQQKQPVSSLQEDCGVTFFFNAASSGAQAAGTFTSGSTGTTSIIDNRQTGCLDWIVTYSPNSAAASVSLAFQVATDVAGVPTTWSNYPGTLNSGINPNTAVTAGGAVTDATGPKYPFLRMNMTVLTGAGATISGKLYGWKRRPTVVSVVAGGGCPAAGGVAGFWFFARCRCHHPSDHDFFQACRPTPNSLQHRRRAATRAMHELVSRANLD